MTGAGTVLLLAAIALAALVSGRLFIGAFGRELYRRFDPAGAAAALAAGTALLTLLSVALSGIGFPTRDLPLLIVALHLAPTAICVRRGRLDVLRPRGAPLEWVSLAVPIALAATLALLPVTKDGGFSFGNDTYTYSAFSEWLQTHAFSETCRLGGAVAGHRDPGALPEPGLRPGHRPLARAGAGGRPTRDRTRRLPVDVRVRARASDRGAVARGATTAAPRVRRGRSDGARVRGGAPRALLGPPQRLPAARLRAADRRLRTGSPRSRPAPRALAALDRGAPRAALRVPGLGLPAAPAPPRLRGRGRSGAGAAAGATTRGACGASHGSPPPSSAASPSTRRATSSAPSRHCTASRPASRAGTSPGAPPTSSSSRSARACWHRAGRTWRSRRGARSTVPSPRSTAASPSRVSGSPRAGRARGRWRRPRRSSPWRRRTTRSP